MPGIRRIKTGMHLLETLTTGMYNEPLSIYREYIQNSVDSIDSVRISKPRKRMSVHIDINPVKKTIKIRDNGAGISRKLAHDVLSSIGISTKFSKGFRGFRGIGRLGGIAISKTLTFRTKAEGESVESEQVWDGDKLRNILNDPNNIDLSLEELVGKCVTLNRHNSKSLKGSYFEVFLEGVSSFRNHIFDITKLKDYLSQFTPVPYYPSFSFGKSIDRYIRGNVNDYGKYDIILNGEKIYKPYKDIFLTVKSQKDFIKNISFLKLKVQGKIIAYGWYAERNSLIGSIPSKQGISGIRVRKGNILIGDVHLLDSCFKESRFNGYIIGEVHVTNPELIPNSRRDDFIDNEAKAHFYNEIVRTLGIPLSKEIRLSSNLESNNKKLEKALSGKTDTINTITTNSEIGNNVIHESIKNNLSEKAINELLKKCSDCNHLPSILRQLSIQS